MISYSTLLINSLYLLSVEINQLMTYFFWCSHYIVPELGPEVKFSYASHKAVNEFKEAKSVSSETLIF